MTSWLQSSSVSPVASQRAIVLLFAAMGVVLAVALNMMSGKAEAHSHPAGAGGVLRLSA